MSLLRKLRRFAALGWRDRLLFIEASMTVLAVRIAMRAAPVRTLRKALRPRVGLVDRARAEAIVHTAWLAAGQQLGAGPCLRRSLTAQRLLHRRGLEAVLRIGGRIEEKKLNGHAWIEVGGTPVGDPPDIATAYQPFAITPEATAMWVRAEEQD